MILNVSRKYRGVSLRDCVKLNGHSYEERLKLFNMDSLEHCMRHFDLLWCYKLILGLVHVDRDDLSEFLFSFTRGDPYKIFEHLL